MNYALWAVCSNVAYVLPTVVAAATHEWLRTLLLLLVGATSSFHHYCAAYTDRCTTNEAKHVRRADHAVANLAVFSVLLLLVPMGRDRVSRYREAVLHVLPAAGFAIAASLVIDTSAEDAVYAGVLGGSLLLSALWIRCLTQQSTLQRTEHWCAMFLRGQAREQVLIALALVGLAAGATLFVWYNSDWSYREPYHGIWHVGSAIAAALLLVLLARDEVATASQRSRSDGDALLPL